VKNKFFNNYSLINIYKNKTHFSGLVTQMLYGEKFKIIKKYGKWWKIKLYQDNYQGYILKKKFITKFKYDYKISALKANIYSGPSYNKIIKDKLPFTSQITFLEKKGSFIRFEKKKWIRSSDIKKNKYKIQNIFDKIKMFKKVKYLWGGKSYKGIDCSALIQLFCNFNRMYFPRDSINQQIFIKKKIEIDNIKKNDLLFWKGHVAIAISTHNLIHAYGPKKNVLIMNIKKTLKIIKKTSNLNLVSIKRFNYENFNKRS